MPYLRYYGKRGCMLADGVQTGPRNLETGVRRVLSCWHVRPPTLCASHRQPTERRCTHGRDHRYLCNAWGGYPQSVDGCVRKITALQQPGHGRPEASSPRGSEAFEHPIRDAPAKRTPSWRPTAAACDTSDVSTPWPGRPPDQPDPLNDLGHPQTGVHPSRRPSEKGRRPTKPR